MTLSAAEATCEELLRLLTQEHDLEWYAADGRVEIALLGEGPGLLARELADMTLQGTRAERDRAKALLASASETLRVRVETETSSTERQEQTPPVQEDGGPPPGKLRVDFRVLEVPADFMRDIGVDCGSLGGPQPGDGFVAPGAGSSAAFLDDTQIEVIDRAIARFYRIESLDSGRLWFWSGEERSLRVAASGVLTLRLVPTPDGRFVRVDLRLRFLDQGALVFVPRLRVTMPSGGTLLVHSANVFPAGAAGAHTRTLMLTVERVQG